MKRGSHRSELEFGSDSFLDIIANIVGILIILIVVAGVKVSRAPLNPPPTPVVKQTNESADVTPQVATRPVEDVADVIAAAPEPAESAPSHPVAGIDVPAEPEQPTELIAQADRISHEIETLRNVGDKLSSQLAELSSPELRRTIAEKEEELRAKSEKEARLLANLTGQLQRDIVDLKTRQGELLNLQFEVERLAHQPPPLKTLEHRITPLSQSVVGREHHFRLSEGKISAVPLDELISLLKNQVQEHLSWIMKHNEHRGVVGPIDGYRMQFVVAREEMTILDEVAYGGAGARVGLQKWELVPAESLVAETADEALQRGSRFEQAVRRIEPGGTVTLWVYPDSFGIYREVQRAMHASGLYVAGRPLPFGIPIAGSPNGTRSSRQ